jgi:SMI1/KNR4 family protein SUKH-1
MSWGRREWTGGRRKRGVPGGGKGMLAAAVDIQSPSPQSINSEQCLCNRTISTLRKSYASHREIMCRAWRGRYPLLQMAYTKSSDEETIARIREFIQDHPPPNLPPDTMFSAEKLHSFGYTPSRLYPVASEKDIAIAEAAIGFPIPTLLRQLYLKVSNGIEGFSYRIFGVEGGCAGSTGTLADEYRGLKAGFDYLGRGGEWKPGMLPFCDWGDTICSCVDCADPSLSVSTSEACEWRRENYTLHDFFGMLVEGKVRYVENAEVVTKTITDPFTGKKTTVRGRRKQQPPK